MKRILSTVVLVITIISGSSEFNNKCVRESGGATFRHPESEQLYFICFNGEIVEVKCRDNYYYNEQISKCVSTNDAISSPGKYPTTFNLCANIEGLTVLPNPVNCQQFYFCMYGHQSDGHCPPNQLFDPILLGCYSAELVNCHPAISTTTTALAETTFTTEINATATETTTTEETTDLTEEISTVTSDQTTIDKTTPPSVTTTNPESVCDQNPDIHLVNNPASCDAFFVCFFEVPIPGQCAAPLFFNPDKGICDDPENVNCYEATTEMPNFCDGIPDGKLFNNPESCSHFFMCMNNVPQSGICPLGLYFNDVSDSCDPPENVDCFSQTIPTETPTLSTTEPPATTEESPSNACIGFLDGTLVNNPRHCDAFYFCFGENAIKGTCPPPSLFNYKLGMCDLPENVICDIETTTMIIETTTKPVDICYGLSDLTFLNDPRKCADHFICFNGQSMPRSCPDGFYFDPSISICARSETGDCDDNESTTYDTTITTQETTLSTTELSTTTQEGTTPSQEPTITTEESTTPVGTTTTEETSTARPIPENCPTTGLHAFPNPQRCSRFWFCASGIDYELACPAGQHFVFATEKCMPRETANCTIPIPVCDPIASAQTLLILHHPHYCNRFFHCFNGLLTPLECAEGEHFDIVSQECGSPANANCEA